MEYINKLIECFEEAEVNESGLIQITPDLRDQIVLKLRGIMDKRFIFGIDLAKGKDTTIDSNGKIVESNP